MRHPPLSTLCVAAVVAAVCSSCATLEDVRSHDPPLSLAAPHNVPDQALLHAAQLHAQAQGWNVVLVDPSESRLEALADEEVSDGLRTRNRWILRCATTAWKPRCGWRPQTPAAEVVHQQGGV